MVCSPFGLVMGCAGQRWLWGAGGVALSTPLRSAVKLEADFRPRAAASWVGPKMPSEPHGAAGAERQRGEAETGEPAGRGLTVTGSRSVILGGVLTVKSGEWLRIWPPAGWPSARSAALSPRKTPNPAGPAAAREIRPGQVVWWAIRARRP